MRENEERRKEGRLMLDGKDWMRDAMIGLVNQLGGHCGDHAS